MARILLTLFLITAGFSVAAQQRPDLTGTWTMDEARSGSPTHESFARPVVWTVQHSGDVLVIDRRRGDKVTPFSYRMSDKPAAATSASAINSPKDVPANRAYWDGNRLILETFTNINEKSVTTREALTPSADGHEFTVERVVEVEHGYTLKGAQNFSMVKDVFRRAPQ